MGLVHSAIIFVNLMEHWNYVRSQCQDVSPVAMIKIVHSVMLMAIYSHQVYVLIAQSYMRIVQNVIIKSASNVNLGIRCILVHRAK